MILKYWYRIRYISKNWNYFSRLKYFRIGFESGLDAETTARAILEWISVWGWCRWVNWSGSQNPMWFYGQLSVAFTFVNDWWLDFVTECVICAEHWLEPVDIYLSWINKRLVTWRPGGRHVIWVICLFIDAATNPGIGWDAVNPPHPISDGILTVQLSGKEMIRIWWDDDSIYGGYLLIQSSD